MTSKIITTVGGGFTGSSIAVQQVQIYTILSQQGYCLSPLTIRLIDKDGAFGPGLPYNTTDDVFLLNQPAYAMSPFPKEPDHFTQWLGTDGNHFATRAQYGRYLKETLHQAFQKAAEDGLAVTLESTTAHVTDLSLYGNKVILDTEDETVFQTDALILATGHQKSDFLHHLDGNEQFFSGVYTVAAVRNAVQNSSDDIAIIGTGQSMMDALAVLDDIGCGNKIYAFSRHLVEPWAFHPENYQAVKLPYRPFFLDPARVRDEKIWSADALHAALESEFKEAGTQGYDVGHVLTTIDFPALETSGPTGKSPQGLRDFKTLWSKIYGNPSPPKRFGLFQSFRSSGQLSLIQEEIKAANIEETPKGFRLQCRELSRKISVSALFNAAAFSREPLSCPLVRQASAWKEQAQVFVAGPPASPDKWGVETFRDNNALIARQSIEQALGITIN